MRLVRKFEEACIHQFREHMIKNYKKTCIRLFNHLVLFMSMAWLTFWLDVSRGKMKTYNKYYESNYTNPFRLILFLLKPM